MPFGQAANENFVATSACFAPTRLQTLDREIATIKSMTKHYQKHISGWLAFLLAPIAIPCIIIGIVCQKALGLKSTTDLTHSDVASYLENWIEDKGGEWDWDDFTSIPITDPFLESVREEAAALAYPLDQSDIPRLRELLQQVKAKI